MGRWSTTRKQARPVHLPPPDRERRLLAALNERQAHRRRAARRGVGRRAHGAPAGGDRHARRPPRQAGRRGPPARRASSARRCGSQGVTPTAARAPGPSRPPAGCASPASARSKISSRISPIRRTRRRAAAGVVPVKLLRDVDDPARVGHEVGRPQDVPRRQQIGHRVAGQLVVGRAGDDPGSAAAGPSRGRGCRPARTARPRRPRPRARAQAKPSPRRARRPAGACGHRCHPPPAGRRRGRIAWPRANPRDRARSPPRSDLAARWTRTPARSRPGSPTPRRAR